MSRASAASESPRKAVSLTPEDHLARAISAQAPAVRARHARLGLASRAPLDRTTHAMLLRQLYMAHFEARRFRKAYEVATQVLSLRVMVDVAHQDAARASYALGNMDDAIGHFRLAARRSPPTRRAFHHWTLGSLLFLMGRYREAAGSLERAARWSTTEKPLYVAHAAIARWAKGEPVPNGRSVYRTLEKAPCGQGYGRFVLGHLAFFLHRWHEAKRYLEAFLKRTEQGRPGLAAALAGEIAYARATLAKMRTN